MRVSPILRRVAAALALTVAVLDAAPAGEGAALLPRFASLRSDEVNLRAGPGTQYPVEWVFQRRYLPVEIVAEYEQWRRVRDVDGSEGWVHKSLLSGRRSILVTGGVRTLYRRPDAASAPELRAEPGVVGRLVACDGGWCRVEIAGATGWLPRAHLWGVHADEVVE
ncbi:MAG: SH3 domain-containing protein [Proteobacteria bacterium]|nr:SH3 domain-containing protein [Pseudomonadota bacterium]